MKTARFTLLILLLAGAPLVTPAQTVGSPAAGYFKLVAHGASDTQVSLPLVRRGAAMGRVTAVGQNTLTLATPMALADGAFATTVAGGAFYAQFVTGNLEGLTFKIVNSSAGGLFTLVTGGDDLTNHPLGAVASGTNGDVVRIRPYWTIGGVFGASDTSLLLDSVTDHVGAVYIAADAILIPDQGATGTEKKPAAAVAYVAGTGWRKRGEAQTDAAGIELAPGAPMTIRRRRDPNVEALIVGYVAPERFVLRFPAVATGEDRDVAFAFAHPGDRTLATSGLISGTLATSVVQSSLSALEVRDTILEFDDTRRGLALGAARRFHHSGSGWFEADSAADTHPLTAGTGYVLRLRGARAVRFWIQSAPN